jgi:hypothetical protein
MSKKFALSVLLAIALAVVPLATALAGPGDGGPPDGRGFDEYGYNYQANLFVGAADGVDKSLDGAVWGDEAYAEDHLVMKWSQGWDEARYEGELWDETAWENNHWNGMAPGGSDEVYQYKIEYDASCAPNCVWGTFEIIQAQGVIDGEHTMDILVTPNGYGDGGE